MKNIFFKLCSLFIISILLSCTTDNKTVTDQANLTTEIKMLSFPTSSNDGRNPFTTSGTMLSFPTFQDYENTINLLESQLEAHQEAFYSQYENLTDDELDDIEDSTGFEPQQPLIDFENQYGFSNSLRVKYNDLEEVWLNNEELDSLTDPDNDILFDEVEQALWNEHQEVMIEGKVFAFGKLQATYEILDDFGTSLTKINNGEDVSNDPNIITTEKNHSICTTWRSKTSYHAYANRRKVKKTLLLRSVPWFTKTKGKITSYKKRRGRWRKRPTYIGLGVQRNLKTTCSGPVVRSGYKSKSIKRRRTRRATSYDWGFSHSLRAQKWTGVYATFYYGGSSNNMALSW